MYSYCLDPDPTVASSKRKKQKTIARSTTFENCGIKSTYLLLRAPVRVRAALEAQLPRLPAVSSELVGRERELAEEAAREYEPTGRDIMAAITTMSRSMVVREEIKADIAEAVLPLNERMGHMEATLTTVQAQTANLNERLVRAETSWAKHVDRIKDLEEKLTALQNTSVTNRGKLSMILSRSWRSLVSSRT